jgi:uncharacterized protein
VIPEFPDFRPVELDDRSVVEEMLSLEQPTTSELTFANIYLWRGKYDFGLARIGRTLAVRATDSYGDSFFLPPVGPGKLDAARLLLETSSVRRVPESMALHLKSDGWWVEADRDNSDYVYLASDLIELPGRKFHRKRNHIAQFGRDHHYEYRRVTRELRSSCEELQETWCDIRDCFTPENVSLAVEHGVVMEALSLIDDLNMVAGAILIDGKVAAFSIGGELNSETFVVHFEKANPAFPGLYQILNKEFCGDWAKNYRDVNREQDLGEPGLRKSKESYCPDHMVDKYTVSKPDV